MNSKLRANTLHGCIVSTFIYLKGTAVLVKNVSEVQDLDICAHLCQFD